MEFDTTMEIMGADWRVRILAEWDDSPYNDEGTWFLERLYILGPKGAPPLPTPLRCNVQALTPEESQRVDELIGRQAMRNHP